MTYSEKLQDPRWQKLRLKVLNRDKWKCKCCGEDKITLHVHHQVYNGNPWDADLSDLKTLCKNCHAILEDLKKDGNSVYNLIKIELTRDAKMYCAIGIDEEGDTIIFLYESDLSGNITYNGSYTSSIWEEVYKGISKTNKNI